MLDLLTCRDVHVKRCAFAHVRVERVELKPLHRVLFRHVLVFNELLNHLLAVVYNAVITALVVQPDYGVVKAVGE